MTLTELQSSPDGDRYFGEKHEGGCRVVEHATGLVRWLVLDGALVAPALPKSPPSVGSFEAQPGRFAFGLSFGPAGG